MRSSTLQTDGNTGATSHQLVGNSSFRHTITFFPPATGLATISNQSPVVANSGMILQPGQSPIYLDADWHGSVVQDAWYVIYTGTAAPVSWIEGMCECPDRGKPSHYGR